MRREGLVSGNIWKPSLGEMVKVQKKPTNASKFSGKCKRVRCCKCHDGRPVSKSMAKAKGRNKRALFFGDDWVLRPPLIISGSQRNSNFSLLDSDYDADELHGGSDLNESPVHVVLPFCDEDITVAALSVNFCTSAGHEEAVYNGLSQIWRSIVKANDGAPVVQHAGKHTVDVMCASNHVNADVQLQNSGDIDPIIWDQKMFTDMVHDDIFDKGDTNHKDENCADDSFETWCRCLTDETLSDTESEKSSIGDDWCYVMPLKIIDDWCLC
ncbi:hypothetical protein L7F22_029978 [Adiantum nelumboides]|nr:hypothetical protein [Adiantum nelumboides]